MRLASRLRSWLHNTFRRSHSELEMDAELRSHLEARTDDLLSSGFSRDEALRRARIEFGAIENFKEECREAKGANMLESLFQDLRFALRMLRKSPGFTAVAVLTLALGIGANTAIFSLVNGVLLRPLPFSNPEQLVSITGTYPKGAVAAMREQLHTMDVAAYFEGHEFNLTGRDEPVRANGALVSAEFLSILGARPQLGRLFYPGEDVSGRDDYVILSHALWTGQFAADPAIVGRSIRLEGAIREVIGVMPADFRFPSTKTQVWIPLHNDPRDTIAYWAGDFMPVIGRLRPGASLSDARAEIRVFQSRVGALFPWTMPAAWNADVSVVPLQEGLVAGVRVRFLVLLGAVGLVLLIACSNVANLVLSRATAREKEIAVRLALGAGRLRIIRQLLTENVVMALFGGLLGAALANGGLTLLKSTLPSNTPRLLTIQMDWPVLVFTGVLALFTGIVFGLAPALHSSRAALTESLQSDGRGATLSVLHRLRTSLAVAEVTFAVLLVTSAGLLVRSLWALTHLDPGFHTEHVLTARITPNQSFCSDASRCLTFYRSVLDQVRSSPGVSVAALVNALPLDGRVPKRSLDLEDFVPPSGQTSPLFWLNTITPGYFQVMGISPVAGRDFNSADISGVPVAIITAETARRFWPNQNAVGKHLRLLGDRDWRTIVGVIPDVRAYDLQRYVPDWIKGTAYVPYNSSATLEDHRVPAEMTIALRTMSDDPQIAAALRRAVTSLNSEAPVTDARSMHAVVSNAASTPASTTLLFGSFAALALVLGAIGVYGVVSFFVSRRTREFGIRIALGAQRGDVLWLVMKEGAKFSFAGIALGLAGAFAATRVLSSELYGVGALDPLTFLAAALVMAFVTLLACYIPTRRATRVDPLVALRYE